MPDPAQLPHLLALLDDRSEAVRRAVRAALLSFGDGLDGALTALPVPPTPVQRTALRDLLAQGCGEWLRGAWGGWRSAPGEIGRLEAALDLVSGFLDGRPSAGRLGRLLDGLAADVARAHARPDARTLAQFLFRDRGLAGARTTYDDPRNSSLPAVLERGRGIPISLACIYILVAHRLGIRAWGCNFPGHFLARVEEGEQTWFVDGFDGGRFVDGSELLRTNPEARDLVARVIAERPPVEAIVARVLRNLVTSYRNAGEEENQALFSDLLRQVQGEAPDPGDAATGRATHDSGDGTLS